MIMKQTTKNKSYCLGKNNHKQWLIFMPLVLLTSILFCSCAAPQIKPAPGVDMVEKTVDPLMGDWQGTWKLSSTEQLPCVAQVIALGDGKYQANLLPRFDQRVEPIVVLEGGVSGGEVRLDGWANQGRVKDTVWEGFIDNNRFTGVFYGAKAGSFALYKIVRNSPTLDDPPPAGAVVLFAGKNFHNWTQLDKNGKTKKLQWQIVDGAMEVVPDTGSIITRRKFNDFKLHLEFRIPFMPKARGQKRGNSGVYIQGRYEIQILDSYGLEGRDNECGGIYKVSVPLVNMCAPPMQWQTYDITFHTARFDKAGNKIKNARVSVTHNGLKIHDNIELPGPTAGGLGGPEDQPGGIYLQDHRDPLQFRNIWLVEF